MSGRRGDAAFVYKVAVDKYIWCLEIRGSYEKHLPEQDDNHYSSLKVQTQFYSLPENFLPTLGRLKFLFLSDPV